MSTNKQTGAAMWLFRWIGLVVVVVAVLGFALQNQDQRITVEFFSWVSPQIPLYLALFFAFVAGMIAFLLISVFNQLQTMSELSRQRRQVKKTNKELDSVREELEAAHQERDEAIELRDNYKAELGETQRRLDDAMKYGPGFDDKSDTPDLPTDPSETLV